MRHLNFDCFFMAPEIKKVAVVGAGISGVVSGKHLLAQGLDVTIFERSSGFGGVWLERLRRLGHEMLK